jgi:hypothetical protein
VVQAAGHKVNVLNKIFVCCTLAHTLFEVALKTYFLLLHLLGVFFLFIAFMLGLLKLALQLPDFVVEEIGIVFLLTLKPHELGF